RSRGGDSPPLLCPHTITPTESRALLCYFAKASDANEKLLSECHKYLVAVSPTFDLQATNELVADLCCLDSNPLLCLNLLLVCPTLAFFCGLQLRGKVEHSPTRPSESRFAPASGNQIFCVPSVMQCGLSRSTWTTSSVSVDLIVHVAGGGRE
ncbi:unnamed protein product, partial [Bubo scandiacus]